MVKSEKDLTKNYPNHSMIVTVLPVPGGPHNTKGTVPCTPLTME